MSAKAKAVHGEVNGLHFLTAYTPDSVSRLSLRSGGTGTITLSGLLCGLDGQSVRIFGLAPRGVCIAVSVAGNAVRSCRTFSTLPSAYA